jgi:ATP/ADP translocase
MDKMELLRQIFEVCIIPLLAVLTSYLVHYINKKIDNLDHVKNTDLIKNIIDNCVIATTQTYVDTLKKEGKFDAEAQKKAFEMTKEAVLATISTDLRKYLEASYDDIDAFLDKQIEAAVKINK